MTRADEICIFDCPLLLLLAWLSILILAVPTALALFFAWDEWFGR